MAQHGVVVLKLLGDNAKESKLKFKQVKRRYIQSNHPTHHGKASVLQLLSLDDLLLRKVLRVPAKRIESKVTGLNIRLQESLSFTVLRLVVSLDGVTLDESAEEDEKLSELRELERCLKRDRHEVIR